MSYDVELGVKVHGAENLFAVIAVPEYSHPTYNISNVVRKCTGWDFEQGKWYCVKDVLPLIERGIHELRFNARAYKQYELGNGYGKTETALEALESLLKCIQEETNELSWHSRNIIPLEYLYVRW